MLIPRIDAVYVHMKDAEVRLDKYTDGSLALVAEDVDEDGMPNVETFSTNLSHYDMHPPEGHVYIKSYAEHEGLAEALAELGLVTIVEPVTFGPFGNGHLVKLADTLTKEGN